MHRGLLWLAVIDLARTWMRSGVAALALAAAIYAIALFARQIALRQAEVLAGYEKIGAATFVAELSGVPDSEIDALSEAIRSLASVSSVAAPYSGIDLGIAAEVSFQVFANEQQQEYLGAGRAPLASIRVSTLHATTTLVLAIRTLQPLGQFSASRSLRRTA